MTRRTFAYTIAASLMAAAPAAAQGIPTASPLDALIDPAGHAGRTIAFTGPIAAFAGIFQIQDEKSGDGLQFTSQDKAVRAFLYGECVVRADDEPLHCDGSVTGVLESGGHLVKNVSAIRLRSRATGRTLDWPAAAPAAATAPAVPVAAPSSDFVAAGPAATFTVQRTPVDPAIAKAACGTKAGPSTTGGTVCAGIANYPGGRCKDPAELVSAIPVADGRMLVSYTSVGCESHANNFGGTMVLQRAGDGWRRTAVVPGADASRCVAIPGTARLACLSGYTGTGSASTAVVLIDAAAPKLRNEAAFGWEISSGASDERDACSGADAVERIEAGTFQGRPALRLSLVRAAAMPPQDACDALDTVPAAEATVAAWLRSHPGPRTVKGWAVVADEGGTLVPVAASDDAFRRMLTY